LVAAEVLAASAAVPPAVAARVVGGRKFCGTINIIWKTIKTLVWYGWCWGY
jgi:hypothetical protein